MPRINRLHAALEPLEIRRLLSASLTSAGQLIVTGDPVNPNTITVGLDAAGTSVDVSVNTDPVESFTAASVNKVIIVGGAGDDTITIDQSNNPFTIPTKIFGGPGNDTITGGNEDDYIGGGSGADSINSGSGNDTVVGGNGGDMLTCGTGNDSLFGGPGADTLVAGSGTDLLKGGLGADSLEGGTGTDTLFGGGGHNVLLGGSGNSFLLGGAGANTIQGGTGSDTLCGTGGNDQFMPGAGSVTNDDGPPPSLPGDPSKSPPTDTPVATDIGTVTGTVTDSTGGLVASATVVLTTTAPNQGTFDCANQFSATTDSSGDFTLDDVPAGTYVVLAGEKGVGFASTSVTVTTDQTSTVALSLVAVATPTTGTGSLSGQVTDSSSAPVVGATVQIVQESAGAPSALLQTTTDSNGDYSFATVPVGNILVVAFEQGVGHGQAQATITANTAVVQNVTIATSAPVVTSAGSVTGTVTDSSGSPVAGASVALIPTAQPGGGNTSPDSAGGDVTGQQLQATTDSSGDYTISNVPAGTYSILAGFKGDGIGQADDVVVTANQATTENLQLELPTAPTQVTGTITGTVTAPDGTTLVSGAQVALIPADLASPGALPPGTNLTTTTNSNGAFTLSDVPAGNYVVLAGEIGVGQTHVDLTVTADPNCAAESGTQRPESTGQQPPPPGALPM